MQFRYVNLLSLGGVNLTDESRGPLQEDRDERTVVVDLASGKKRKFVKGIKRKWSVSWENVSESATYTVDGKGGRDEIRALAQNGSILTLIIQDGRHSTENYTVFVDNYSESLIMRRAQNRYTCTLNLIEQG